MSIFGSPKLTPEQRQSLSPVTDPPLPEVDIAKRYDVYCTAEGNKRVVYRNALFKSRRSLLPRTGGRYDIFSEVVELEQENGKSVYLVRHSVIMFCEHGTPIDAEPVG